MHGIHSSGVGMMTSMTTYFEKVVVPAVLVKVVAKNSEAKPSYAEKNGA